MSAEGLRSLLRPFVPPPRRANGTVSLVRREAPAARFAAQTHCKQGHAFTPENTYSPPKKPMSRECRRCVAARSRAYQERNKP